MKILITAGPTREPIDPVRYLSNRSSGKMGYAIARAALAAGHEVVLISGPVSLDAPDRARIVCVTTSEEMFEAVHSWVSWAEVCVLSAAVADFRPAIVAAQKIKKTACATLTLELVPTRDILLSLRDLQPGSDGRRPIVIGFAAETDDVLDNARRKLRAKGCALLIVNDVSQHGIGFDADDNAVDLLFASGEERRIPRASKDLLAQEFIQIFSQLYK